MALNRPFTKGLLLKGAYTLGKSKNFGTDDDGWTGLAYNTPSLLDRNYSNAGYDRRHNFQLGFVYQLPWQSGSGGNPLRLIINDWQMNGVVAMFSGRPFTAQACGSTSNCADFNTPENLATANQVSDLKLANEIGGSGRYYDPASFVRPALRTMGNTQRNQFYGPGGFNLDASIFRGFPIGGSQAARVPSRGGQPDELADFQSSKRRRHQRRLHAHHGAAERLRHAPDPTGAPLPVLARARV